MPNNSENIFAIGDIHGCHEELGELIRKLPLNKDSTIIFLGDYIDRGPESKKVVDDVLNLSDMFNVITLKGNHEELFLNFLAHPKEQQHMMNFVLNGGAATLASYSPDGVNHSIPLEHLEFFKRLRTHYLTDKYFFVHAGVPPDFRLDNPINTKMEEYFLWIRSSFLTHAEPWERIIIHGHSPVEDVEILPNRINLDTGCVYGHFLSALSLGDGTIYQVKKKDTPARPRQILSGTPAPRARRFVGRVPVKIIEANSEIFEFESENFNELGMLLSCKIRPAPTNFTAGKPIEGFIELSTVQRFRFKGVVVRAYQEHLQATDAGQPALKMAIKFDLLEEV